MHELVTLLAKWHLKPWFNASLFSGLQFAGGLSIRLGQGLWSEVNGVNVTTPFQHPTGVMIRQHPSTIVISSESLGFKVTSKVWSVLITTISSSTHLRCIFLCDVHMITASSLFWCLCYIYTRCPMLLACALAMIICGISIVCYLLVILCELSCCPYFLMVLCFREYFSQFTWDGSAYGEVEVETKLKNKLCGLCGNFNDNNADELTLKDGRSRREVCVHPLRTRWMDFGSCLLLSFCSLSVKIPRNLCATYHSVNFIWDRASQHSVSFREGNAFTSYFFLSHINHQ